MIRCSATARGAEVITLRELIVILDLHKEGLSVSAIAERTGLDRKTIRKYIARGIEAPVYGPREPRARVIAPYEAFVRERLAAFPELSIPRLLREIRPLGYTGGRTMLGDFVREVRPAPAPVFEVRFETDPGQQAQVDFAHFKVVFADEPQQARVVWLFSLVLGHSRYLFARFCLHQDLQTLLRLHIEAFEHLQGVPGEILYDRMKTAVLGEGEDEHIVYNRSLLALAGHYGFSPRACKAYRAKTKGKVERPYRYIRQDFFLAGHFANLEDLNAQLQRWLDTVANVRTHGTTARVVAEHFAQERASLGKLPAGPFNATLKLERRISHEGVVSVGGNRYSVPDGTRSRTVEVHTLAQEIRIFEDGQLIAAHPVLHGRRQYSILPAHRKLVRGAARASGAAMGTPLARAGEAVARRPLSFYDAVGQRLARNGRPA
jgi:transposase